ncbi:MAG: S4 domain-containing protein [Chitinophagales bacterium]
MSEKLKSNKIRLNKYLAHSGIDNRRNCETLIKKGLVKVNDEIITNPNVMINLSDKITFNDKIVKSEKKVYILINKPKKFVFESIDKNQLTLTHLIRSFSEKLKLGYSPKLFPILDIDKKDCGLLLITNDEELLSIYDRKTSNKALVYTLLLDKELSKKDEAILLDKKNEIHLNEIHFLNNEYDNISIGVKVKFNNNLKSLFEAMNYKILQSDRVIFDDLNKKNLPRGKWRFLSPKEVIKLKHLKY